MWETLFFHDNAIRHETDRALLIKVPDHAFGRDVTFWHPSKLARYGDWWIKLSFPPGWTIKLRKGDKITEVTVAQVAERLTDHQQTLSANIDSGKPFLDITQPAALTPEIREVHDELRND